MTPKHCVHRPLPFVCCRIICIFCSHWVCSQVKNCVLSFIRLKLQLVICCVDWVSKYLLDVQVHSCSLLDKIYLCHQLTLQGLGCLRCQQCHMTYRNGNGPKIGTASIFFLYFCSINKANKCSNVLISIFLIRLH